MASVTTSKFLKSTTQVEARPFSLIEHKGLVGRLAEELNRAAIDFTRNPSGFFRELFTDDNKDLKRRRLIYAGLGCALIAHLLFIAVIFVAGWIKPAEEITTPEIEVTWLPNTDAAKLKGPNEPQADVPKGAPGDGGGGGGRQAATAASGGVLPKIAPIPPIIKHDAPEKNAPVLAVNPNIQGSESAPPPIDSTIGVPTGDMNAPPSPGTGDGGGLGSGKGSGIGPGTGPGAGEGSGGNKGGGQFGSPNGTDGLSVMPFSQIQTLPREIGFTQFRWLYRPTPVVTPEAQENKIAGTVLLRATFHADGRISNVEIVNQVPYMTDSAVDALMKSKFKPATINGKPVTLTRVPVRIDVHY